MLSPFIDMCPRTRLVGAYDAALRALCCLCKLAVGTSHSTLLGVSQTLFFWPFLDVGAEGRSVSSYKHENTRTHAQTRAIQSRLTHAHALPREKTHYFESRVPLKLVNGRLRDRRRTFRSDADAGLGDRGRGTAPAPRGRSSAAEPIHEQLQNVIFGVLILDGASILEYV